MPRRKVEEQEMCMRGCDEVSVPGDDICEACKIGELTRAISGWAPQVSNISQSNFPEEVAGKINDTESGILALISEHYLKENNWDHRAALRNAQNAFDQLSEMPGEELEEEFKETQKIVQRKGRLTLKDAKSNLKNLIDDTNYPNSLITVLLLLNISGYEVPKSEPEPQHPPPRSKNRKKPTPSSIQRNLHELYQALDSTGGELHVLCGKLNKCGELCETIESALLNFGDTSEEGLINLSEIIKTSRDPRILRFREIIHEYKRRCIEGRTRFSPFRAKKKRYTKKVSTTKRRHGTRHRKPRKHRKKKQTKKRK